MIIVRIKLKVYLPSFLCTVIVKYLCIVWLGFLIFSFRTMYILSSVYLKRKPWNRYSAKQKGVGNDGEPDARQKLEFEKKGQKLVGIKKLWMVWDDIWEYSIWPA